MMTHENYLEQCVALTSLYPFAPGFRYLSILPTNHAIDFMVGFFGPFICGATVVHLRTLRPEFVREAFTKYKITYVSLVPLVLKNLQKGLQARFDALPPGKRQIFNALVGVNKALTKSHPRLGLSRSCSSKFTPRFGGELRAIIVGGAFTEPQTLQFFYDLGIPVANGYGLTEAGTAITVNDLHPFRADTVGKPLPGMEVRIVEPDKDGIGEVHVRSKTVMSGYLNEPELTAETIVDGWLKTGDLGRFDPSRPSATLRAQEKHDRHRRREEHLSRRHRSGLRAASGQGILRLRRELHLAAALHGGGATGARDSSRARPNLNDDLRRNDLVPEQPPAQLQARSWNRGVRRRFSAHGFA